MVAGMRAWWVSAVVASVCLCAVADVVVVDSEKLMRETIMGGPINEKGLMPCADECLCDVPTKPHMPDAKLVTMNEVIMGWKKVTETEYCDAATQLQMRLEGSDTFQTVYNGPASEYEIRKLPLDIHVSFRLRERNCAGAGPFSDEYIIHTPSEKIHPGAPTLVSKDQTGICVRWDPYPEIDVTLTARPVVLDANTPAPAWQTVYEGQELQACAENLTSSTYYEFRITVHDDKMEEPNSESLLAKTTLSAPLPASRPRVQEATDTTLKIVWDQTVSDANKSPAQLYVVEVAVVPETGVVSLLESDAEPTIDGEMTFYRVSQVTVRTAKISGLSPGRAYAVRVRAVNAAGESSPSEVLIAQTKPAAPSAPTRIIFEAATSDTVKLAWRESIPNGSPIVSYELSMSPGGAVGDFYEVYSGVKNHTHVEGLSAELYYGFRVRAKNAVGAGFWSDQFNIRTASSGQVLTEVQLRAASVPARNNAAAATLVQSDASATARNDAITASQNHLQLVATVSTHQVPQPRLEPDLKSDDLTGDSIVTNDPNAPPQAVHVPPVEVNGQCDLREGCKQKDATIDVVPSCPSGCFSEAGHGFCLPGGKCHCAFGWKGDDCNTALCPDLGGESCGGHGKCTAPNQCTCQPGFNSLDCSLYWVPTFHIEEILPQRNISARRAMNVKSHHYSTSSVFPYATPEGGIVDITAPAVVPTKPAPSHPRHRSLTPKLPVEITGSYVALPADESFDFDSTSTFTVSLWFRATEAAAKAGGKLVTHGKHLHGAGYGLGMLAGGQIYCGVGSAEEPFRSANLAVAVSAASFSDGVYHHVACRYNGKRKLIHLLVDGNELPLAQPFPYTGGKLTYAGELDFSDLPEPAVSAPDYPFVVGASWDYQASHFDGEISDVRVWRLGRTYDELRAGMWAPLAAPVPGLALYIPLNDCTENRLHALRWTNDASGGKPQILRFQNTLTDCRLDRHPIAKPETEDGALL